MNVPAYMRGNLAVEERQSPTQRVKIKETRKVVYRASRLPIQEKLLYLFTLFLCVVVAGVIIWRYAQIYQINTRIHNVEYQISQLEAENSVLKEKMSRMMDPELYMKEAAQMELAPITDDDFVRVPAEAAGQGDGLALNP